MGGPGTDIVVAFDFGFRRIGVATANLRTTTASPLTTLRVGSTLPWDDLDAVIEEWQPQQLVVGLPNADTAGNVARRASDFIDELGRRYGLPVAAVDESLTSRAAESDLIDARRAGMAKKRIRRESIDRYAACLIAEQWMRERSSDRRPTQ
jgi:putative Holliday junction resolvase